MTGDLIKTKLMIPPLRPGLVTRESLFRRLDEGLSRKLILISAPAGYGKTTLLSAWVRQTRLPAAWLALEEGDNDPNRFAAYFQAAVDSLSPEQEKTSLETFRQPGFAMETYLAGLLNQLYARTGDSILVLDDFHTLITPQIHRFIAALLDHLPPLVHLVIASRADPPLPLPRLRARGQMVEIRLPQMRFSQEEAAAFLQKSAGLPLDHSDVAALTERTEGWAAGLQMAALAVQSLIPEGRQVLADYVRSFAGSSRYVLDYLVEEVLEHQPQAVRTFLLQTSILERMCAALCDTVMEIPDGSQALLEGLEAANQFVIPLDDRREWYRYHRLFADLLRKRLVQSSTIDIPQLHIRAGRWFYQQGMAAEAVSHALTAKDWSLAADWIEASAETALLRGETATVLDWIEALPAHKVQTRPRLALYQAACLVFMGRDLSRVDELAGRIREAGGLEAEVRAVLALKAALQTQVTRAQADARAALASLGQESRFFHSLAVWVESWVTISESELGSRVEYIEHLLSQPRTAENRMLWVNTLCSLAEARYRQGDLFKAREHYRTAIEGATAPDGSRLPVAGEAMIGYGFLLREWNELESAEKWIREGLELVRTARPHGAVEGWIALAMCHQAAGDPAGMRQMITQARQCARQFSATDVDDRVVNYFEALALHRSGDHGAIARYFEGKSNRAAAENQADGDFFDKHLNKYEQILRARAHLASGRPAEALTALDTLLPAIEREGRTSMVIEIGLLRALAFQALGQPDAAQEAFERALCAAEPGGWVRLFVDEGLPIQPLLENAAARQVCAGYARRLLHQLQGPLSGSAGDAASQPETLPAVPLNPQQASNLTEPLSMREIEVLRLLASSLPAKVIASHLGVAESTLNSHIKSIYGKLGVHRRLDAVRRAGELGLMDLARSIDQSQNP